MANVVVSGSFDNLRTPLLRLLDVARGRGTVTVHLWSDHDVAALDGRPPRFPLEERFYLVSSVRYVDRVVVSEGLASQDALSRLDDLKPNIWLVEETDRPEPKVRFCQDHGIALETVDASELTNYPGDSAGRSLAGRVRRRKRAIVTGCFDWLHSGHVRFFEEVSELGDLFVVVGHDANIRYLKGEGHPMLGQDERRYAAGSIRFVTRALISSGSGWMDAEPEIAEIAPDLYVVNEDGDRPEKRTFCREHGLEYVVLKREPRQGLPARSSTALRGF